MYFQCPRCFERVNPAARICPHCRTDLTVASAEDIAAGRQLAEGCLKSGCAKPVIIAVGMFLLIGAMYEFWADFREVPAMNNTARQMAEESLEREIRQTGMGFQKLSVRNVARTGFKTA